MNLCPNSNEEIIEFLHVKKRIEKTEMLLRFLNSIEFRNKYLPINDGSKMNPLISEGVDALQKKILEYLQGAYLELSKLCENSLK